MVGRCFRSCLSIRSGGTSIYYFRPNFVYISINTPAAHRKRLSYPARMEPSRLRLRHHPSVLTSLLILLFYLTSVQALQGNPESPCLSKCQEPTSNTTVSDIVCNDSEYNSTDTGTRFEDCVKCQLESVHVDPESGATDVQWGLCTFPMAF